MTSPNELNELQIQRLEKAAEQIAATLREPQVAARLRTAPGQNEWSAMQVMGHVTEMLPYWLKISETLIEADGPLSFGRTHDDPERLAGVERGSVSDPEQVLGLLQDQVTNVTAFIRTLTPEQRAKKGTNVTRGEMNVGDIVERNMVAHAEDHLAQVRAALEG